MKLLWRIDKFLLSKLIKKNMKKNQTNIHIVKKNSVLLILLDKSIKEDI